MKEINDHRWSIEESIFYVYLTTIPATRANDILALRTTSQPGQTMAEFAENLSKEVSDDYVLKTPVFPNFPRYVINNGNFQIQFTPNTVGTQLPASDLLPVEIRFLVENRSVRMPSQPPGRLKSLNSFMVFRAFVAPILGDVTQSTKSRACASMWAQLPSRGIWTVLAAAYTVLRDHFHMPDATLKTYLEVVGPFVGLQAQEGYLRASGWLVEPKPVSGEFRISRSGHRRARSTTPELISIFDIVTYCRFNVQNYAIKRPDSSWPFTRIGESTMAIPNRVIDLNAIDQSELDPLYWCGPPSAPRAFTWDHIYGRDDGTVPEHEFMFVPPSGEMEHPDANGLDSFLSFAVPVNNPPSN